MAIAQTGSVLQNPLQSQANTGTVSSTITVPADAELVLVGVSGYQGTNNGLAAMTFTKGGVDTAMSKASVSADATTVSFQGTIFYLALPDTGANKTLKWDWIGSGTSSGNDWLFSLTFWKGVDTADPVRSSGADQDGGGTPYTTGTLTALTGDKIVAFVSTAVVSGEGTVDSWSNLTELSELTHQNDADGAWATGDPTGDVTVAALTDTNFSDGGITAIVIKPATATPDPATIRLVQSPMFW